MRDVILSILFYITSRRGLFPDLCRSRGPYLYRSPASCRRPVQARLRQACSRTRRCSRGGAGHLFGSQNFSCLKLAKSRFSLSCSCSWLISLSRFLALSASGLASSSRPFSSPASVQSGCPSARIPSSNPGAAYPVSFAAQRKGSARKISPPAGTSSQCAAVHETLGLNSHGPAHGCDHRLR